MPGDCLSVRFAMRLRAVRVGNLWVHVPTCGRHRQATSEIRPPRARPHEPRSRPGRGGSRTCADFENARRPDFGARLASARVAFVPFWCGLVSSIVSRVCRPTADEQRVTFAISGLLRLRSGARPGPWPCDVRGACAGHAACGRRHAGSPATPRHVCAAVRRALLTYLLRDQIGFACHRGE